MCKDGTLDVLRKLWTRDSSQTMRVQDYNRKIKVSRGTRRHADARKWRVRHLSTEMHSLKKIRLEVRIQTDHSFLEALEASEHVYNALGHGALRK